MNELPWKIQILFLGLLLPTLIDSIGPILIGSGIGAGIFSSALYSYWSSVKCIVTECCAPPYVRNSVPTHLQTSFDERIFGQHVARSVILAALKGHFLKKNPTKALTLSFHGTPGSGKTFVANWIAESLFQNGGFSSFVHKFVCPLHFPHESKVNEYKNQLQDWIKSNVSTCSRSLFIFDEVDKMPLGVLDAIIPFIDHHETVNNIDFRNSIFIFLSNTGSKVIIEKVLSLWSEGTLREDMTYASLEDLITLGAFNEEGGFKKSQIIEKSLIDYFVPFLPHERSHVKLCLEAQLRSRNETLTESQISYILDQMSWGPSINPVFSTTGCKRIGQKLDLFLEERYTSK